MQKLILRATSCAIFMSLLSFSYAHATTNPSDSRADAIDKISYAIGHEFGNQIPSELNIDAFIRGVHAGYEKQPLAYTDEELEAASLELKNELTYNSEIQSKEAAAQEQKFLSENAKKPGVITTKSGLQYKIIQQGKGKRPTSTSEVTVHYKGQLLDGTEFDSSYKRNQPISFTLNQVISGWTEGLQLMKEGSKATLYIPSKLAYGTNNMDSIPANSTLIFDVELIKVK